MALELSNFYRKYKLKKDKNLYYGVYKNRIITVNETMSLIRVIINFNKQISKEAGKSISEKCHNIKEKYRALQNAVTTNVYQELVIYKSFDIIDQFETILNEVFEAIDFYSPTHIDTCPLCQRQMGTNEPFLRLGDNVIQAHSSCVDLFINQSKAQGPKKVKNGKLKIVLSSIVSMLVVCAVFVGLALSGLFEEVTCLSGFAFTIIVTFSLKYFKILPEKSEKIIIIIFAAITILLSTYVSLIGAVSIVNPDRTMLDIVNNTLTVIGSNYKIIIPSIALNILLTGFDIFMLFKTTPDVSNLARKL